jgi:uncharacterized circularly permuted ATP-grasp superfamily protein/uncharacterized alpha-E superfamily protein
MDTAVDPAASTAPSRPGPAAAYGAAAGRAAYDEMLDRHGRVRPSWRRFVEGFEALGPAGRAAAAEATRRHLRESGIAFNVYADPDDRRHAWRLDLIPLILTDADWATVAAGVVQRARLIEAVLADLYGPRRLLLNGILPAAPFLGAADHVRAQHGLPGSGALMAYACDVTRTAEGRWVVLGDQTDCPIGNGYVIASRVALSHGLAALFVGCNTRRLAGHYMAIQAALQAASPRDDGRIVVLAPGPESPSYFSHAYLARYLGYTLAQAGDLTVRDDTLCLKTLDGLQRVDLLLRKQAGATLDPLFMPGGGLAGVAGLVHTARRGRLVVANGLGTGLAQGRALAPWTPLLARRLLGEELLLDEQETLWLGDPAARARALDERDGWLIAPLHARNDPGEPGRAVAPATLAATERAALAEQLARDGWARVALRPVAFATSPCLDGERLVPQPWAVRCFVARTEDGFTVLPGGLARLAGQPTGAALPNGFGSKDLWITADAPEDRVVSLLRSNQHEVHLRRSGRDLLSRTADNLFWLGRYAERAEGLMRLLRSVLVRVLEDGRADSDPRLLTRLLDLVLDKGEPAALPEAADPLAAIEAKAAVLLGEPRGYGLRDCLDQLHRTATLARDQISHDAWRMLATLHLDRRWRPAQLRPATAPAIELLDDGIRALNAFSGTEAENMTRNFAWRFLEMGRRLERAAQLVDLARVLLPPRAAADEGARVDAGLHLLLELGDSFMTYRSRYVMMPLVAPVVDLLILDESNPRAVAFQLAAVDRHLAALPADGPYRSAEQRLALRLVTRLRLAEIDEIVRPAAGLLAGLGADLPALSDLIVRSHFAHADTQKVTLAMRRAEPS